MAEEIIAALRGDKAQREAAYVELSAIARRGASAGVAPAGGGGDHDEALVDVAAECVGPLVETIVAAHASVVDPVEFRRAHLVLGELCLLDPLQLIGEWIREARLGIAWGTPGNAWATVFDKDPSELTRDDALTVAAPHGVFSIQWCRGAVARLARRGSERFRFQRLFSAALTRFDHCSAQALIQRTKLPASITYSGWANGRQNCGTGVPVATGL